MYIEGKILIIGIEYMDGDVENQMITCYFYSHENGSLTQIIDPTPIKSIIYVGDKCFAI